LGKKERISITDGEKLFYTAESVICLANAETGNSHLVAADFCDYLGWNNYKSSFTREATPMQTKVKRDTADICVTEDY